MMEGQQIQKSEKVVEDPLRYYPDIMTKAKARRVASLLRAILSQVGKESEYNMGRIKDPRPTRSAVAHGCVGVMSCGILTSLLDNLVEHEFVTVYKVKRRLCNTSKRRLREEKGLSHYDNPQYLNVYEVTDKGIEYLKAYDSLKLERGV